MCVNANEKRILHRSLANKYAIKLASARETLGTGRETRTRVILNVPDVLNIKLIIIIGARADAT